MKYYKRNASVEAVTFDELVQHGIEQDADLIRGMPRFFKYRGHRITHENDNCYLIASPAGGSLPFKRGDMLTFCGDGSLFPMELAYFCMTYESLPDPFPAPPPEQCDTKWGSREAYDSAMDLFRLARIEMDRVEEEMRASTKLKDDRIALLERACGLLEKVVLQGPSSTESEMESAEAALRAAGYLIPKEEGMTIAGDDASELGKLMREQRKGGPVPHA